MFGNSGLHLVDVVSGDGGVGGHIDGGGGVLVILAGSVLGGVWVDRFELKEVLLKIFESS